MLYIYLPYISFSINKGQIGCLDVVEHPYAMVKKNINSEKI